MHNTIQQGQQWTFQSESTINYLHDESYSKHFTDILIFKKSTRYQLRYWVPFFEILLKWIKFEVKPPFQQQANLKLSFISGHFRSFYLSKLFMVGKSFPPNLHAIISVQILSFPCFPILHNASYYIREKRKLLSNCCLRRKFVVSFSRWEPFLKDVQFW